MLKKPLILLLSISSFVFANNFHDLDYLFYKYKIRYTIEQIEKLKQLYPKNSSQYKILQKTENFFMRGMPVDAYGTYVRIKLHNIIDNKLSEKKPKQNNILSADTDLNYLYLEKEQKLNNTNKKKNNEAVQNFKKAMMNPNGLTPEQLTKIFQGMMK